jgi:mannose-6-phosphate isomerase-like protein (cupin superfamily)
MPAAAVNVGPVTVTYVHEEPASGYALLEWEAPPGAASPPVHVHHHTEEGFYVVSGTFRFLVDGEEIDAAQGSHMLVRAGHPHTFWNAGDVVARCLLILTPPDFAPYFRELSAGLAATASDAEAIEVRRRLSAKYDIEVVGPPIHP